MKDLRRQMILEQAMDTLVRLSVDEDPDEVMEDVEVWLTDNEIELEEIIHVRDHGCMGGIK